MCITHSFVWVTLFTWTLKKAPCFRSYSHENAEGHSSTIKDGQTGSCCRRNSRNHTGLFYVTRCWSSKFLTISSCEKLKKQTCLWAASTFPRAKRWEFVLWLLKCSNACFRTGFSSGLSGGMGCRQPGQMYWAVNTDPLPWQRTDKEKALTTENITHIHDPKPKPFRSSW